MTHLRQRMIDDTSVRGLSENTRKSYLGAVAGLARQYRRGPDRIEAREVQDYLLFLHDRRGLSWTSCNTVRHGLRFFYRVTLRLPDPILYVPGAKQPAKLPEILNQDELVRLFTVTTNPKQAALRGLVGRIGEVKFEEALSQLYPASIVAAATGDERIADDVGAFAGRLAARASKSEDVDWIMHLLLQAAGARGGIDVRVETGWTGWRADS